MNTHPARPTIHVGVNDLPRAIDQTALLNTVHQALIAQEFAQDIESVASPLVAVSR